MHLRGHANVLKRLLVHVCGANLGLLMRELTGVGTPRSLQGRAAALLDALIRALSRRWCLVALSGADRPVDPRDSSWFAPAHAASPPHSTHATKWPFCHGLLYTRNLIISRMAPDLPEGESFPTIDKAEVTAT